MSKDISCTLAILELKLHLPIGVRDITRCSCPQTVELVQVFRVADTGTTTLGVLLQGDGATDTNVEETGHIVT